MKGGYSSAISLMPSDKRLSPVRMSIRINYEFSKASMLKNQLLLNLK